VNCRALYVDSLADYLVICVAERDTLCIIPFDLFEPTVPQSVKTGFILSCSPLLYGVSLPLLPAVSFEPALRCQGLFPLRDIIGRCPLAREIPLSRYVPSSGFLNPSTVYSTARLCGLIASRCHAQGSLRSGVSPTLQPSPTRRRVVPPYRCRPIACRQAGCHDRTSRLRGFTPQLGAFLRVDF